MNSGPYLALTVLYLALIVLYLALTVLYLALQEGVEAEVAVPRLYEDMTSFDECKEVFERVLKVPSP